MSLADRDYLRRDPVPAPVDYTHMATNWRVESSPGRVYMHLIHNHTNGTEGRRMVVELQPIEVGNVLAALQKASRDAQAKAAALGPDDFRKRQA